MGMGKSQRSHKSSGGFSLIEMLAVMAIMSIMATITFIGVEGLATKEGYGQEIFQIAYTFDQARAYALANNTYVFVGITEVDGTQSASVNPQASGYGRVAMAVVASMDGTRMYDQGSLTPTNLTPVVLVQHYDNIHMADFSAISMPTSGGMVRPVVSANYSLANSDCNTQNLSFNWPLTGTPKYTFSKVVSFDPTGVATLLPNTYSVASSGIVTTMELGLQPAHGNQYPPLPTNQATGVQAAIQVDGVSGSVELYQP
jgi:prepilin-type N-terminal cleavage/methylation domain-containing protein